MKQATKTLEFTFERTIAASPDAVYDAWLSRDVPGTVWHVADTLLFCPEVDGFFYLATHGTPHYGRFLQIERPARIQHTWVSPNTLGEESTVTVTFEAQGEGTLMTLVHSDLPDHELARGHEKGWNYFLGIFPGQF